MKVLITGGAGFIGCHLADRFLRDGFEVRILDSLEPRVHPAGLPAYVPKAAEFIHGNVCNRDTLLAALKGVDIVSHQAAYQDYMPDFSRFLAVNAVSTALLFELIVEHKLPVKKIVVASSQAVYGEGQYCCPRHGEFQPPPRSQAQLQEGNWEVSCPQCGCGAQAHMLEESHHNPFNQYAVSKLAEEKTALGLGWLHGIPTVALRYSITQGRRQSPYNHYSGICRIFCSRAQQRLPLTIYEDGLQTRDFVHVDDVVEANMLVLQKDAANGHVFNVGGGIRTTVLEYARRVLEQIPSPAGYTVSREFRRGDNRHSVSSSKKLEALGWRPTRGLDDILEDYIDWLRESGGPDGAIPDAAAAMRSAGVLRAASLTVPIQNRDLTSMSSDFTIPVYFQELSATLGKLPVSQIDAMVSSILSVYGDGKTIFLFGNGGSAALASHMACDLGKGTACVRAPRLRVVSLTDNVPLITAWANDTCYANIFAEQLANLITPGDLALAISGSGNSPNILAGLQLARDEGLVIAGMTGFEGGKMKALCDVCIVVPSDDMQIIEDAHSSIAHAIFRAVRQQIETRNAPRSMAAAASANGSQGKP